MQNHLFQGVGRLSPYVFNKGKGSWVYTQCGRKFLDFTSQIGVTNTGHAHPRIVQAVTEQISKLPMSQVNLGYHEPMLELTESLLNNVLTQQPHLDRVFYSTTGAEAVENAVKLATYATGRPGVIVFQGGYHGRTALTMAMTSSSVTYKQNMTNLNPSNIYTLPFPYELQGYSIEHCLKEFELLFQQQVLATEIACMIIEPVLGEGGYVPAPVEFLQGLQKVCKKHGILLIIDEVQTGFGRTGKLLAHTGLVEPDILVMAKGLASGYPISAVAARGSLADQQAPGSMGGTYAGHAVSCAAAVETIKVLEEEKLVEQSQIQGAKLRKGLKEMQSLFGNDIIRDVRGPGCMIGVEFVTPGFNKKVSQACLQNGMLLLPASVYPTLRFIPPLTISDDEVEMGLDIFQQSIRDVLDEDGEEELQQTAKS
mmetsp:Transcript_15611/g.23652  ORF Transcript_15611/g.23652 Transcript_15611/m.23652 type:complete len:425 (+) Transcript_15611:149-1423(+)|eukprot:CAMPEP_0178912556 /NCGR_PEP_ID=MMETSP0786-20121207/10335_1 /TAXON_ID=186022 /ORGANISM="Thalassionema frauenfeldii, Strain CCMP 1798" /LENGTH=424 /DNA_ID=CAMNT_0020585165 /DNA_START=119 /DNA_END=1393 /DNA_ORIENTATION=+